MLVLLPASVAKTPIRRGQQLDLDALSFPSLSPTRAAVLEALTQAGSEPDAPAAAVETVYAGVMYQALGLADLGPASRRRARGWIVVISALWGAVRLGDRIPEYRLDMCGRLPDLAHLTDVWREPLADVLPAEAGGGVVVDCRSSEFATAWRPTGELAERTVVVRVVRDLDDKRGAGAHNAKRTRGLLVRQIVTDAIDPPRPEGLAGALAQHFDVDLLRPRRPGRSWELLVVDPRA